MSLMPSAAINVFSVSKNLHILDVFFNEWDYKICGDCFISLKILFHIILFTSSLLVFMTKYFIAWFNHVLFYLFIFHWILGMYISIFPVVYHARLMFLFTLLNTYLGMKLLGYIVTVFDF